MQNVMNIFQIGTEALLPVGDIAAGDNARIISISRLVGGVLYLLVAGVMVYHARKHKGSVHSRFFGMLSFFVLGGGILFLSNELTRWPEIQSEIGILQLIVILVLAGSAAVVLARIQKMLMLRNPDELQHEIAQRRKTESELRQIHAQLEDVIEQRTAELAEKSEEMEQFLNTVSHDLKNPVVTCAGLIGMLRDEIGANRNDETNDLLGRIERSMIRMRQLIDALLNLSRIGRVTFEMGKVDTQEMMQEIGHDLEPRLKAAGVTLEVGDNLPCVNGDAHWLTEVFENLITNALKYGCDNPRPRITVGCTPEGEEARIFVRDNGKGIDPAQHARVFEPFQRLRSDKEGTGMGLAIVTRIIKMHGGRVWIESATGKGAIFWVSLPKAKDKQREEVIEEQLAGALS